MGVDLVNQPHNKKKDYKSRKFILCLLVIFIGTIGLFTNFLTGAQIVSLFTLALTIYSGANIYQHKIGDK